MLLFYNKKLIEYLNYNQVFWDIVYKIGGSLFHIAGFNCHSLILINELPEST